MDNRKLIERIRKLVPTAAIRTTFIVGYPTETEEDFQELYDFVKEMQLDRVGVFEFSKEKNTKAYSLKPQVLAKDKKKRKQKLMELQQLVSKEINEKMIGQEIDCIIEAINSDGTIVGRTYKDAPEVDGLVFINTDEIIEPGDIITAKITGAVEYDLIAEY